MCVHDTDAITLREYVETYREESENEYSVSVLDVLRPLSKHSFVSYLATYEESEPFTFQAQCSWWDHEADDRVIHHFSIVKCLKYLDAMSIFTHLHRIIINFCIAEGSFSSFKCIIAF